MAHIASVTCNNYVYCSLCLLLYVWRWNKSIYRVLPRDAMLARYTCCRRVISCVRLSVRLSVTSRYCIETLCGWGGFLAWQLLWPILNCVIRKFGYLSKNKGTALWNFAPNSPLRKFHRGRSMVWSTKLVDGRACGSHVRRSSASWLDARGLLHVGRL